MIVLRISGGLGNQMFQYAFARALQKRDNKVLLHWHSHHSKAIHNGFELDRIFQNPLSTQIPLASQSFLNRWRAWRLRKTARTREIHELQFQPNFLEAESGYLDGYWQTQNYFEEIAEKIRSDFTFKPFAGRQNVELQERLAKNDFCSVHIRRGDYVGHPELGGICEAAYYQRALEELDLRHPNCPLLVFSDDIDFSKKLLNDRKEIQFCHWNRGSESWMDMALMCRCTHHIIANSSFSWWGAWLSDKKGTVVAPKKWSKKYTQAQDECLREWLRI
jgi:hypothetical protein